MHKSGKIVMASVLAIKTLKVGKVAEQTKEDNEPPEIKCHSEEFLYPLQKAAEALAVH